MNALGCAVRGERGALLQQLADAALDECVGGGRGDGFNALVGGNGRVE
jgi:hypothetical protein